jgi:hypothetical protein
MVREKAAARGIGAGLMAQSVENAVMRRDQGFALVALGADTSMLIRALTQGLEAVRGKPEPRLWF